MSTQQRDYVDVVYNEADRPLTDYPRKLTRYLFDRYGIARGARLLDVGCGRGEFLRGFIECGVTGFGVDQSEAARRYCPGADLRRADLENEPLPFEDNSLDVVYSKSVVEHFYYPERLVREMYRVLKPGGQILTLCPDWEHNIRNYFEDFTHRTPFTLTSLRDIHTMSGFESIQVERFRQLPVLWSSPGATLLPLAELTRLFVPRALKPYSKWVRFSKEIMLLASARKPSGQA